MTVARAAFVLLLLLFTACKEGKEEKVLPLAFQRETLVEKKGADCNKKDFQCSIISLEVLKATGDTENAEKINLHLRNEVFRLFPEMGLKPGSLQTLATSFLNEYEKAAEKFAGESPWQAYVHQNIYLNTRELLSIGTTAEIFSGGAHGYQNLHFLNLDPTTGETLSLKELFLPGFVALVEKRFRKIHGIPAQANINSTGLNFEENQFYLPENIGFTEKNVVLIYDSYEIAPYAAEEIRLDIPLDRAREFLNIQSF